MSAPLRQRSTPGPRLKRGADLTGVRFGMLVVLGAAPRVNGYMACLCRCECGTEKAIQRKYLRSGDARSCGCVRRSHGHTAGHAASATYSSWRSMRERCTRPGAPDFEDYGGRGITVCERWASFENFLADMGERPAGTSIDRIDGAKGYAPDNCRWATASEQQTNRCTTRFLTHDGLTFSIAEWARRAGLRSSTLRERLRRGWGVAEAIETPPARRRAERVDASLPPSREAERLAAQFKMAVMLA